MKKKIYAVKKGWKPGIYFKWLDAYEQIKGFGEDRKIESFVYEDDLADEGEEVEGSYAYALKQAQEFLEKAETSVEPPGTKNGFEDVVDDEPLPFDNYVEYSRNENIPDFVDAKEELLNKQRAEENELFIEEMNSKKKEIKEIQQTKQIKQQNQKKVETKYEYHRTPENKIILQNITDNTLITKDILNTITYTDAIVNYFYSNFAHIIQNEYKTFSRRRNIVG